MFFLIQFIFQTMVAGAIGFGLRMYLFPKYDYEVFFEKEKLPRDDLHRKVIDLAVMYVFGWLVYKVVMTLLLTVVFILAVIFGPLLRLFGLVSTDEVEAQANRGCCGWCICLLLDFIGAAVAVGGAFLGYLHKYTYEIYTGEEKMDLTGNQLRMINGALGLAATLYIFMFIRAVQDCCCGGSARPPPPANPPPTPTPAAVQRAQEKKKQ